MGTSLLACKQHTETLMVIVVLELYLYNIEHVTQKNVLVNVKILPCTTKFNELQTSNAATRTGMNFILVLVIFDHAT